MLIFEWEPEIENIIFINSLDYSNGSFGSKRKFVDDRTIYTNDTMKFL